MNTELRQLTVASQSEVGAWKWGLICHMAAGGLIVFCGRVNRRQWAVITIERLGTSTVIRRELVVAF